MRDGDIATPDLFLRPLTAAVLDRLIRGQTKGAQALLGAVVPEAWATANLELFALRLSDLENDAYRPWNLRALVSRELGTVVGHAGFHTAPDPAYLSPYAIGAIEMGYSVETAHRGQRLATQTLTALMDFARKRGVMRYVLSIAPDNLPSIAMAERAGFIRVGEHFDQVDGLEEIWLKDSA